MGAIEPLSYAGSENGVKIVMVGALGIGPRTSVLSGQRSTIELCARLYFHHRRANRLYVNIRTAFYHRNYAPNREYSKLSFCENQLRNPGKPEVFLMLYNFNMKGKTVIAAVSAVLVAALVFAALLFFWPKAPTSQESMTVTTFTEPSIGISVNHPSSWMVDLKDIEKKTVYFSSPLRYKEFSESNKGNQFDIALSVYDSLTDIPQNSEGLSVSEFAASDAFTDLTSVSIGSREGYRVKTKDDLWPTAIFIEANSRIYRIEIAGGEISDEVMAVVSDFKFGGLEE